MQSLSQNQIKVIVILYLKLKILKMVFGVFSFTPTIGTNYVITNKDELMKFFCQKENFVLE